MKGYLLETNSKRLRSLKFILLITITLLVLLSLFNQPSHASSTPIDIPATPIPSESSGIDVENSDFIFETFDEYSVRANSIEASGSVVDVFTVPINNTTVQSNIVLEQDVQSACPT